MKTRTFKLLALLLITFAAFTSKGLSQTADGELPAYRLFNNSGKHISYAALIDSLRHFDVVFIGEQHNCPITHWLEYEIAKSLYAIHKEKLMIGEEMMESDNQLILNEYMEGKITYQRFEEEARLWPNYKTDYYPVVFFAKEHHIPFIATNVPRRYANAVKYNGLAALDSFSREAKRFMAPLPIAFHYDKEKSEATFGMMSMMAGHKKVDYEKMAAAQAIKDATMAWFIAKNIKHYFLHINGSFHTEAKGGIIPYLLQYKPGLRVVTVMTVRQESIQRLDDNNKGRADYYICVPEDMTTTY